jgi:hypothetical protein
MTTTAASPTFTAAPTTASPALRAARPPAPPDRLAACGMLLATVLSVVFVAVEPEVRAHGARAVLEALAANASIHEGVHALESLFVLLLAHGVASLGKRLGLDRPAVRFGLTAYLAGAMAMLAAATFDGFVTPTIATVWLSPGHDVQAGLEAVRFAGITVQSFATMSWGLEALGAFALSAALFADGGAHRRLGVLGLVSAGAPLVALAAAGPAMDTRVVVGILLTQAVWNLMCAAALWRRERA